MNQKELNKVLSDHLKYLNDDGGQRANLQYANLQYANLNDSNLQGADLKFVNLNYSNLQGADLEGANLKFANLEGADLKFANLQDANLDFTSISLSCGGLNFKIDERLAKQLMYHVINLMQYSKLDVNKVVKKQMYKWLSNSHLVTKHGLPILKKEIE